MKEMYQIKLLAVSLLFSMSAVFTGCSADIEEVGSKAFDDGVSNDGFDLENDENVVALQGFFSKTFPRGEADSPFYPEMQNYEGVSPSETFQIFKDRDKLWRGECVVLNSNEELSAQYTGDVEIPVVDFSKISVILGRVYLPNPYVYQYRDYSVANTEEETLVNLDFGLISDDIGEVGFGFCSIAEYYFYEVVPKFQPGKVVKTQATYPDSEELWKNIED